mmetsp:Transcript_19928/g.37505  ORF Transcript_19928/g.37505 Transcript_19928/m.37505 type:complete len:220 (-) Transcript_19928:966-1625(-)
MGLHRISPVIPGQRCCHRRATLSPGRLLPLLLLPPLQRSPAQLQGCRLQSCGTTVAGASQQLQHSSVTVRSHPGQAAGVQPKLSPEAPRTMAPVMATAMTSAVVASARGLPQPSELTSDAEVCKHQGQGSASLAFLDLANSGDAHQLAKLGQVSPKPSAPPASAVKTWLGCSLCCLLRLPFALQSPVGLPREYSNPSWSDSARPAGELRCSTALSSGWH